MAAAPAPLRKVENLLDQAARGGEQAAQWLEDCRAEAQERSRAAREENSRWQEASRLPRRSR